jgi:hypothetical protein
MVVKTTSINQMSWDWGSAFLIKIAYMTTLPQHQSNISGKITSSWTRRSSRHDRF